MDLLIPEKENSSPPIVKWISRRDRFGWLVCFRIPGNVLRPGQFGRVRFISYTKTGALLVPQKAVVELQGSYQVAVVGSDNKVSLRTVKVGERIGAMWIVDQGLKPGERVVVEGVQKVRDSMPVNPTLVAAPAEGN